MMTHVSAPTCVAGVGICAGVSGMPSTESVRLAGERSRPPPTTSRTRTRLPATEVPAREGRAVVGSIICSPSGETSLVSIRSSSTMRPLLDPKDGPKLKRTATMFVRLMPEALLRKSVVRIRTVSISLCHPPSR